MPNSTINRRSFIATGFATAGLIWPALPALAKTISRFSLSKDGFALKGYDATAYFEADAAATGSDANKVDWKGATWRFATAAEAELFRANPEAYAPQFGGYCTRAMSLKKEVPGDPEVWRIHKGKLYVFFAKRGGTIFDKGEDAMIELAQAHWDSLTFTE